MKKYWWLMGATAVTTALILLISYAVKQNRPAVETIRLQAQTVEQTVLCTGKVEEAAADIQAVAAAGQQVQIRVAVPEARLRQVAVGQQVTITGAAFGAAYYSGTVAELGSKAYTTTSGSTVVDAVIALDAADATLRCGLTAKADICVDRVENALLLPYACLQEAEDDSTYVYLLQDGCAVRRTIETGALLADGVVVTAGLQEGDRVIQNPQDIDSDGQWVREE